MKTSILVIGLLAPLLSWATEYAEMVLATTQKITCTTLSRTKRYDDKGEFVADEISNGVTSVSTRTTLREGDVEHRFSEYSTLDPETGRTVYKGRNVTKFITKILANGLVLETSESHSINMFEHGYSDKDGKRLSDKRSISRATYKVDPDGRRRILVRYIVNGKEEGGTTVESETPISNTIKEIKIVENTPYVKELSWGLLEYLQYETTCGYELMD